jgi:ATP/maltotriose-dependent transcriptional regulator MalT
MGELGTLREAHDALARAAWTEARTLFQRAVDEDASPEAWEGLGFAAYWLDDGPLTFEARLEAFRLYREKRDVRGAARVAVRLSEDYLLFRGEPAVSNGWILRAERLLAGIEPGPEHVWLLVYKSHYALAVDPEQARSLAEDAAELAQTLGLFDLEMLSLAVGGMALVLAGCVAEGMSCLDEATTAATAGEIRNLEIIPWTCCYLVAACESVRDYKRAAQWCEIVREVAARWHMRPFSAICVAHYAGILIACGRWTEAEAELGAAKQLAEATRPALTSECIVRLAELRRRQGSLDEAARLVQGFETEAAAQLVLAQVALDRGEVNDGMAIAERLLRMVADSNRSERATALEVIVRASAAGEDLERAQEAAEELARLAEVFDTAPLHASACVAQGLVAACTGELERARRALEDAAALFDRSEIPYEAARARAELAGVLRRLECAELADREERKSLEAFVSLGIAPVRTKHDVLTPRELEVLRLIADGRTDREIAIGLSISEHTVHRHVSNILTKLALSSRSAAVARAANAGLL